MSDATRLVSDDLLRRVASLGSFYINVDLRNQTDERVIPVGGVHDIDSAIEWSRKYRVRVTIDTSRAEQAAIGKLMCDGREKCREVTTDDLLFLKSVY